jgi:hypothetical protein
MKLLLRLAVVLLASAALIAGLFLPARAWAAIGPAGTAGETLPGFEAFVQSVMNGKSSMVRGVYVPEVLALPVEQQPAGKPAYVSPHDGVATQFRRAADFGVIGLLAHNYSAGKSFFNLKSGQEVRIVYGDGAVKVYIVAASYHFQALQPNSPTSNFVALDTGQALSANKLFDTVYYQGDHVTFQTCIKKDGLSTWGRLFVIAAPEK